MKRKFLLYGALLLAILLIPFRTPIRLLLHGGISRSYTRDNRLRPYGVVAEARLQPYFIRARVAYPPKQVVLVGLKRESILQVYAADSTGHLRFIRSYPIRAASGTMEPKLHEGDYQVPEGIYRIEYLNPNSAYHLSLRLNYPNAFDRRMAARDGRHDLGGDVMIHGNCVSAGCLAMGDEESEDLFVLAADAGIEHIEVILSPLDYRTQHFPSTRQTGMPTWTSDLYRQLEARLDNLPSSP